MRIRKWVGIVTVVGVSAVFVVWMMGARQIIGRDLSSDYTSSNVPAPGPNQKKIVLKNLGMT